MLGRKNPLLERLHVVARLDWHFRVRDHFAGIDFVGDNVDRAAA